MPRYDYKCVTCGYKSERICSVKDHVREVQCHHCNGVSVQVITAPMVVIPAHMSATGESGYRSPIDGRPITTAAQRREDMARNDCVEYEPGMRQDVDRRVIDDEKALDRAVDETFDREIAKMPAAKLERLDAEMSAGMSAEVARV